MFRRPHAAGAKVEYTIIPQSSTGSHVLASRSSRNRVGGAVCAVFVASVAVCIGFGLIALFVPTGHDASIASTDISDSHKCLRVARFAEHTTVALSFGRPSRNFNLLLRMDVLLEDVGSDNVRVFDDAILQSSSLSCNNTICQEIGLLQLHGVESQFEHVDIVFTYDYTLRTSSAASRLGLHGEMLLSRNHVYFLTRTHLCWMSNVTSGATTEDAIVATVDNTTHKLHVEQSALASSPAFASTPFGNAAACANLSSFKAELFPVSASLEQQWLVLQSNFLYERDVNALDRRRVVLELGPACAALHEASAAALSIYLLDCELDPYATCRTAPAVPFRRLAHARLLIDTTHAELVRIVAEPTVGLLNLPKLMPQGDAIWTSIGRLLIMLLTSAIVFIRSSQPSSSSKWIFIHAIRLARGDDVVADRIPMRDILADGAISFLAIVSRIVVLSVAMRGLLEDKLTRTFVTECIASITSVALFVGRYFVLKIERESPLSKLGGPTGIIDASAAVLLAYAEAPLYNSEQNRFEAIARMLVGLLVAVTTLQRCFFSCSACYLSLLTDDPGFHRRRYQTVLTAATAAWALHGGCLAILIADVFVLPAAYTLNRRNAGDVTIVKFLLFFGVICTVLPQITRVSHKILKEVLRLSQKTTDRRH